MKVSEIATDYQKRIQKLREEKEDLDQQFTKLHTPRAKSSHKLKENQSSLLPQDSSTAAEVVYGKDTSQPTYNTTEMHQNSEAVDDNDHENQHFIEAQEAVQQFQDDDIPSEIKPIMPAESNPGRFLRIDVGTTQIEPETLAFLDDLELPTETDETITASSPFSRPPLAKQESHYMDDVITHLLPHSTPHKESNLEDLDSSNVATNLFDSYYYDTSVAEEQHTYLNSGTDEYCDSLRHIKHTASLEEGGYSGSENNSPVATISSGNGVRKSYFFGENSTFLEENGCDVEETPSNPVETEQTEQEMIEETEHQYTEQQETEQEPAQDEGEDGEQNDDNANQEEEEEDSHNLSCEIGELSAIGPDPDLSTLLVELSVEQNSTQQIIDEPVVFNKTELPTMEPHEIEYEPQTEDTQETAQETEQQETLHQEAEYPQPRTDIYMPSITHDKYTQLTLLAAKMGTLNQVLAHYEERCITHINNTASDGQFTPHKSVTKCSSSLGKAFTVWKEYNSSITKIEQSVALSVRVMLGMSQDQLWKVFCLFCPNKKLIPQSITSPSNNAAADTSVLVDMHDIYSHSGVEQNNIVHDDFLHYERPSSTKSVGGGKSGGIAGGSGGLSGNEGMRNGGLGGRNGSRLYGSGEAKCVPINSGLSAVLTTVSGGSGSGSAKQRCGTTNGNGNLQLKFKKKLLDVDGLWALLKDFGVCPSLISKFKLLDLVVALTEESASRYPRGSELSPPPSTKHINSPATNSNNNAAARQEFVSPTGHKLKITLSSNDMRLMRASSVGILAVPTSGAAVLIATKSPGSTLSSKSVSQKRKEALSTLISFLTFQKLIWRITCDCFLSKQTSSKAAISDNCIKSDEDESEQAVAVGSDFAGGLLATSSRNEKESTELLKHYLIIMCCTKNKTRDFISKGLDKMITMLQHDKDVRHN